MPEVKHSAWRWLFRGAIAIVIFLVISPLICICPCTEIETERWADFDGNDTSTSPRLTKVEVSGVIGGTQHLANCGNNPTRFRELSLGKESAVRPCRPC